MEEEECNEGIKKRKSGMRKVERPERNESKRAKKGEAVEKVKRQLKK